MPATWVFCNLSHPGVSQVCEGMTPVSPVLHDHASGPDSLSRRTRAANSINNLVGAGKQLWRDFEPERLGGLSIDDKRKPGRLFHRQLTRRCTLEDLIDVGGSLSKMLDKVETVVHQAAVPDELSRSVDGRQPMAGGQLDDQATSHLRESVRWNYQTAVRPSRKDVH